MNDAASSLRRRRAWLGLALWLPLLLYLGAVFFAPLADMLRLAVVDEDVPAVMPGTAAALHGWRGPGLPPEPACAVFAQELVAAREARTLGTVARRLNLDDAGLRSALNGTARRLDGAPPAPGTCLQTLAALDPAWGTPPAWHALARATGPFTDFFVLASWDRRRDDAGRVVGQRGGDALYVDALLRTFGIAAAATVLCVLLGLPAAYLLVHGSPLTMRLGMLALLLPLWTSVLVRSASWLVLLQENGLVNQVLVALHLIETPLALVYNRTGVLIALTHVLLPYAVLPISNSMKSLSPTQMRAASSLGAAPLTRFVRIYLPQILPGIAAGAMLVFIIALGYYITPLLLGGPSDQLLPYYIAYNATQTVNWGLAAALGGSLLLATLAIYAAYVRLVGVRRIGLG